jgi:hypothetical protein
VALNHAAARTAAGTGRRHGSRRARALGTEHRRIQQYCVFAHHVSARPIDRHQQRRERLVRDVGRMQMQHVAPIGGLLGRHAQWAQEGRIVEAAAAECRAVGEGCLQAGKVLGASPEQVDFSIERRIERGFEMDISEPQRERGHRRQQCQQHHRAEFMLEHLVSQRTWLLSNPYKSYS